MSALGEHAQIHQIVRRDPNTPLRCSGCGRSDDHLPHLMFAGFSAQCFRGVIVDSVSGASLERLDDLYLCGECVLRTAELVDPDALDGSAEIEAEKQALQRATADSAKILARLKGEIKEDERHLARLAKEQDARDALAASVTAWSGRLADAVNELREARFAAWRAEYKSDGLADARKRLRSARAGVKALVRAGEGLVERCDNERLYAEARLIRDRIGEISAESGETDGI